MFSYPSGTSQFVVSLGLNNAVMEGRQEALLFYNRGCSKGTAEAVGRGDVNVVRRLLQTVQEVHMLVLWKR